MGREELIGVEPLQDARATAEECVKSECDDHDPDRCIREDAQDHETDSHEEQRSDQKRASAQGIEPEHGWDRADQEEEAHRALTQNGHASFRKAERAHDIGAERVDRVHRNDLAKR